MILLFSDWVLSKPQGGLLGYQYDNLTRELVVQGDLPEGWAWDILVSASGKGDTWPLALGDGEASITLTDDNLSVRGEYYLQLRGTNGDQVRHTNVITAYNSRSLSGAGQWPTLPTEWIQAEKDIKELNAHPPVPGSDGYWLLWDLSSHSYQESDLPVPVGPAGPPNVLEIGTVETLPADQPATASITGESPAQKLNLGIPQGKQGATGNPGAPGKDGQNGVTPTLAAGDVETLEPDQPATASVTGEGPAYQINLGIPRGQTGAQGAPGQNGEDGQTPTIAVGTVTTLDPGQDATAEITGETPNLVLSLGIPQGPPGQDGVQLNDSAVNTSEAWSSKKIVDTLCPSFSVSGNPVTCNPVEGYPLGVTVTMEPIQEGTGDPSPENVRPITGRNEVAVTRCGKNLLDSGGSVRDGYNVLLPNATLVKGATYTYTVPNTVATDKAVALFVYASNTKLTGYLAVGRSETFTVPNDADFSEGLMLAGGDATALDNVNPSDFMVELGSTPTAYEPYQGETSTLTLPETIYGGTVDAVTGVGSKEWIVKMAVTSTYRVYILPDFENEASNLFYLGNVTNQEKSDTLLCSHLPTKYIVPATSTDNGIYGNQEGDIVYIRLAKDIQVFKSWLDAQASAGTPVQLAYKLATPEPFQATGNQPLPAVAGLNTVYTDGDSLAVSGRQDLLYTLQNMQAQTTNLNRFIAEGGTR